MGEIHTYTHHYENAHVVGVGKDRLMGTEDVLIVRCPHFGEKDLEFYASSEEGGEHHNVGNYAFWFTRDE